MLFSFQTFDANDLYQGQNFSKVLSSLVALNKVTAGKYSSLFTLLSNLNQCIFMPVPILQEKKEALQHFRRVSLLHSKTLAAACLSSPISSSEESFAVGRRLNILASNSF